MKFIIRLYNETMFFVSTFNLLLQEKDLTSLIKLKKPNLFQIEFTAHGAKSSDPVINRDTDLFLMPGSTLSQSGIKHETEVSFFK